MGRGERGRKERVEGGEEEEKEMKVREGEGSGRGGRVKGTRGSGKREMGEEGG